MRADFKINILLQPRIAADPHDFNQLEISVRFADFGITADDSCAFTYYLSHDCLDTDGLSGTICTNHQDETSKPRHDSLPSCSTNENSLSPSAKFTNFRFENSDCALVR